MKKLKKSVDTPIKKKIIKLWLKTKVKVVHPSYRAIGKKVPCSHQMVDKTVREYKRLHNIK